MPRFITINKDLILFRIDKCDLTEHRIFPEGSYAVEPAGNPLKQRGEAWLKIVGQPWGNARPCWEAVSVEVPRIPVFGARIQVIAGALALLCILLSLLTFAPAPSHGLPSSTPSLSSSPDSSAAATSPTKGESPDLAAMKTELFGLCNERANLTNHYPLLLSPAQKAYEDRRDDAIYGLDVYPRYLEWRKSLQTQILRRRGELDLFITALNSLEDQLYHVWHDWGVTNRAATLTRLKKERAKFIRGEVMQEQSRLYATLQKQIGNDSMVAPCLAFNESLEHEIGDLEGSWREVARQNRDCADHVIRLTAQINALDAQIDGLEHPPSFFKRLAFWKAPSRTTNSSALP
jgi:hypothetical protein